jgi:hypothetical protein
MSTTKLQQGERRKLHVSPELTKLFQFCGKGDIDAMKQLLLSHPTLDPTQYKFEPSIYIDEPHRGRILESRSTLLHGSIHSNSVAMVEYVMHDLKCAKYINQQDSYGFTPVMLATYKGLLDIVKHMVRKYRNVINLYLNPYDPIQGRTNIVQIAVFSKNIDLIKYCLTLHPSLLSISSDVGLTLLQLIKNNKDINNNKTDDAFKAFKWVLENHFDPTGNTPFFNPKQVYINPNPDPLVDDTTRKLLIQFCRVFGRYNNVEMLHWVLQYQVRLYDEPIPCEAITDIISYIVDNYYYSWDCVKYLFNYYENVEMCEKNQIEKLLQNFKHFPNLQKSKNQSTRDVIKDSFRSLPHIIIPAVCDVGCTPELIDFICNDLGCDVNTDRIYSISSLGQPLIRAKQIYTPNRHVSVLPCVSNLNIFQHLVQKYKAPITTYVLWSLLGSQYLTVEWCQFVINCLEQQGDLAMVVWGFRDEIDVEELKYVYSVPACDLIVTC